LRVGIESEALGGGSCAWQLVLQAACRTSRWLLESKTKLGDENMASANNNPVLFERSGRVAIVTLNRPEVMNAVNGPLWLALGEALEEFSRDPALWVLIITAAGDRSFCAGTDLKAKAKGEMEVSERMASWGYAGVVRHYISKPIIAAVNGYALGGGTELALACDLIIASERATFGLPEVKVGLLAGAGGLLRLSRQIPLKLAMHCILTGNSLSAEEAKRWGLINEVVPHDRLLSSAIALAETICENSPSAVMASKDIVYRGLDLPLDFPPSAWEMNDEYIEKVQQGEDAIEGPRAFSEKRKPVWKNP
jgi:crotonobetainyl-CoA hydratase